MCRALLLIIQYIYERIRNITYKMANFTAYEDSDIENNDVAPKNNCERKKKKVLQDLPVNVVAKNNAKINALTEVTAAVKRSTTTISISSNIVDYSKCPVVEPFETFSIHVEEVGADVHQSKRVKTNNANTRNDINIANDSGVESIQPTSPPIMSLPTSLANISRHMYENISRLTDVERFYEVREYHLDILKYFQLNEMKYRPEENYMESQPDVNHSMRAILIEWLVDITMEYDLSIETLYLAVNYMDRFLSKSKVVRDRLQLVGASAMFIAAKYEEIEPPNVYEFIALTDDAYDKTEMLDMERYILKILNFELCVPTTYFYVNFYSTIFEICADLKFLAQYMCELTLLRGETYLRFSPSMIAAAAIALSYYMLGSQIWSPKLENATTYKLENLKNAILCLHSTHYTAKDAKQQSIQTRYADAIYNRVSKIKAVEFSDELFDSILANYNEVMEWNDGM